MIGSVGSPSHVVDAIDIKGSIKVALALSTSAAESAALTAGVYDVYSDVDSSIRVAVDNSGVTVANGYTLFANNVISVVVNNDNDKIGGILASGTGNLYYHKVR